MQTNYTLLSNGETLKNSTDEANIYHDFECVTAALEIGETAEFQQNGETLESFWRKSSGLYWKDWTADAPEYVSVEE